MVGFAWVAAIRAIAHTAFYSFRWQRWSLPRFRLDIPQDSEFATGYGHPNTASKWETDTDLDIRNALSIFRGFKLVEKVARCTIIHSLFSEAYFQPSVPWLRVCLWCNLCTVVYSHSPLNLLIGHAKFVSMNPFLMCQDRALSVCITDIVCCVPGLRLVSVGLPWSRVD